MRLLNSNEMKQVEQYTAKYGLSYQRMMENAGAACARNIRNVIESDNVRRRNVVVVCGKGNNGGDGFVVARKFSENGYNVCVVLASGYPVSQESIYMYKMVIDLAIPTVWYDADKLKTIQTIKNADVIVDAIFGFSFYGTISDDLKLLVNEMTNAKGMKFSIDVPSGVYCDSGYKDENAFASDYTIAISSLKPAHIIHPASDCCGDIIIANIGIPEDSYNFINSTMYTYSKTEVARMFPKRNPVSHKGDFGHVLSICGSKRMVGAPVLAAKAALRSGVGLVTAAFPESIYYPMTFKLTESLFMPLKETADGTLSKECIPQLIEELPKFSAILFGCGIGVNEDTTAVLDAVLKNSTVPVIIDADGINILAKNLDMLKEAKAPIILTPHPKEMSRLTGLPVSLIQSDRMKTARTFAAENNVYVVLKGTNTVVASPESEKVYINTSGNSGLAKGGSGDVLAGIVAALTAQGFEPIKAATVSVYIHGHCADTASDRLSQTGMLPSDVIDELASVFGEFEG
ncbi:MAG: NAD(P)H-hydrate dehydratase [Faecalibacterium sp.]|nr:NAD(P)H-hydrate dehydratase [Ruminococcus sp.]MCM1392809.1 NAD(P)H-hydrate dehydratase [Ruminococcus sp.]MCM1484677.1 NAD(P)H-hydrate dehydratase [Faecalibacterium sp.]